MRRWLIWAAVSLVAGVMALIVLAIANRQGAPDFRFLEGRQVVTPSRSAKTAEQSMHVYTYSFKDAFEKVAKAARTELMTRGFWEVGARERGLPRDKPLNQVHVVGL